VRLNAIWKIEAFYERTMHKTIQVDRKMLGNKRNHK